MLSGINAVGKSTVLHALAALRQSHASGLLGETGLLLNGELVELGTGRDVLHEDYETEDGKPIISVAVAESGLRHVWMLHARFTPHHGRIHFRIDYSRHRLTVAYVGRKLGT
jgi:hypothetical protein